MKKLEFDATFGDQIKHVEIAWPAGGAGAIYISIDNYHEGQMVYQQGKWNSYMNSKTVLTGDDISILVEIIEKNQIEK